MKRAHGRYCQLNIYLHEIFTVREINGYINVLDLLSCKNISLSPAGGKYLNVTSEA